MTYVFTIHMGIVRFLNLPFVDVPIRNRKPIAWADPEGVTGGPDLSPPPPGNNCQIINFCHVEIFRKTPSGNLDPPPLRKFSGSAHGSYGSRRSPQILSG